MEKLMPEEMSLKDRYDGKRVRVYLRNGSCLKGQASFSDEWINVDDSENVSGRVASANLDHVVSIAEE